MTTMTTAKSQAVQLLLSRESTPGTAPTTLWRTLPVNPSGLQGFAPKFIDVTRNVLSPNMTDEKGDHVGQDANFTLVVDLTKDYMDFFGPGLLRSVAKVPGDEPTTQIYYPTAAVDGGGTQDSFAVPADGDLLNGTIVRTRGFVNAANNGVFVLEGTSTTTAIKTPTATLVAETVSIAGSAEAEAAGFQFTTGDGQLDVSGDFITTTQDLTLLNLVDGQEIWFGGIAAGTRFATAAYNGRAFVNGIVTTNKIPLKWRSWTPAAADNGATKTIQIFYGVLYRNVADGHADYIEEPVWHFEKRDTGVGTANAAVFVYGERAAINSISIAMGVEKKIEVTTNFLASKITAPRLAATRKAGPSTATPPVATELFDTTAGSGGGDMPLHRIVTQDGVTEVVAAVNSCTLMIEHGAQGQKQLAGDGLTRINFGKIRPKLTMETFYDNFEVPLGIDANTSYRYEAVVKNASGAISFTLPGITLRGGEPTYGEDSPVMMGVEGVSHRDPISNVVMLVNIFAYLPRSTITAV